MIEHNRRSSLHRRALYRVSPFTLTQCDCFFPHLRRAELITLVLSITAAYLVSSGRLLHCLKVLHHISTYTRAASDVARTAATATLPASAESKAYGFSLLLCRIADMQFSPLCGNYH